MRKTRSQTQAERGGSSRTPASSSLNSHPPPHQLFTNSEYEQVKNMVLYFRVFELQRLLNLISNKPEKQLTRKVDLQNRVLHYLVNNFRVISAKIEALYKSSSAENRDQDVEPSEKRMYQPQMQMPVQSDVRGATIVGNNIVLPFTNSMTSGYPIHPDVRLRKLAFYDELATLLQPSTLVPSNTQRLQEAVFYFTLTPQQATDIASNRDIRNGLKAEHTIQVQLRFCLLETSCEQEDCFPPNVIVKVNNKLCPLPNPIPTNRPNVEPKRPPRPVNVTTNVKLSPTVTNNITIQWCPDFTRGYVISAYLVRKLTSAQLLLRMKTKGSKSADYTRALIKEKLNEDADCEIATTMLKVSLICPLGKMRMTIPCRASTCSHLQCFDASLYLQMNERKPTWNCPVCDKPAVYDKLVIDGYFQEVLASSLLSSDDNEIQLHKDGSWSTPTHGNDAQILDTPKKSVQKVEVISDDLEVITTEPEDKPITKLAAMLSVSSVPPPQPSIAASNNANNEPTSTTNNETVDLTLSDSDEDDMPLRKRIPPKTNNVGNGQKATVAAIKPTPNGSKTSLKNTSVTSRTSKNNPSTQKVGKKSRNANQKSRNILQNIEKSKECENLSLTQTQRIAENRNCDEHSGLESISDSELDITLEEISSSSDISGSCSGDLEMYESVSDISMESSLDSEEMEGKKIDELIEHKLSRRSQKTQENEKRTLNRTKNVRSLMTDKKIIDVINKRKSNHRGIHVEMSKITRQIMTDEELSNWLENPPWKRARNETQQKRDQKSQKTAVISCTTRHSIPKSTQNRKKLLEIENSVALKTISVSEQSSVIVKSNQVNKTNSNTNSISPVDGLKTEKKEISSAEEQQKLVEKKSSILQEREPNCVKKEISASCAKKEINPNRVSDLTTNSQNHDQRLESERIQIRPNHLSYANTYPTFYREEYFSYYRQSFTDFNAYRGFEANWGEHLRRTNFPQNYTSYSSLNYPPPNVYYARPYCYPYYY